MLTHVKILGIITMSTLLFSCKSTQDNPQSEFKYTIDQFADVKVMRYQVSDWDSLTLAQKELVYYLSQASLCGRDIVFDQNFKYNLLVRRTLEAIEASYKGNKDTDSYKKFYTYLKRVWFSNGIHHHYSGDKFTPEFEATYFAELVKNSDMSPVLAPNETPEQLLAFISPILFDPTVYPKRISLDAKAGLVETSACNFYEGVSTTEVENFYANMAKTKTNTPISYGLNSQVVKENGKVVEKVWKLDGMYGPAIAKMVYWLEKAAGVAQNPAQKAHILKLIEYYKTGDLKTWDEYNVMWVADNISTVDYVNGFIENYGDPMGMKANWEGISNFTDIEATKRTKKISENAQWFEDHSPVDQRFKKEKVKGVSAKVINVAQLGGACYPTPPIGINLPNADWIRRDHGSKSVTIQNISAAYDAAAAEGKNNALTEFACTEEELVLHKKYGTLAGNLHTDLHECLGHGSGKLLPGTNSEALKNYSSAMEEARADLFALYYMMDPKMIELDIIPSLEVAKVEYNTAIRNGLINQITRIELGKDIEQAHMRCRALIANWSYQNGLAENVIEKVIKNGKTYYKINDYQKLRLLFGKLLAELQRIKSEGDYAAAKTMIDTYAVKIDPKLHKEVLDRYTKLQLAPYGGFVNPKLSPVVKNGQIVDIEITYPDD
ncbi:MAG: dihydrofolate reductase, partial [Bacteroidales bacterium]